MAMREDQRKAEAQLLRDMEEYITHANRRYFYSGVCNLLGTIAGLCEEQSQLEGDDWEKAAQAIDECASACDLPYKPADPEPPGDAYEERQISRKYGEPL